MALRRRVLLVVASAVVALAIYVAVQFRADMKVSRAAVASHDTIAVDTSFGSIEPVDVGSGFPVLSIHGTGGGFDQGLALADDSRERQTWDACLCVQPGLWRVCPWGNPCPGLGQGVDARLPADWLSRWVPDLADMKTISLT